MRPGDWKTFPMGRKKGVTVGSYLHFSSHIRQLDLGTTYSYITGGEVSRWVMSSGAQVVEELEKCIVSRKLLHGPGNISA